MITTGQALIYTYVPREMIPENLLDRPLEEFWRLVALARHCRQLRQQDIQIGIAQAFRSDSDE